MTTLELAVFHPASPAIAQFAGVPRIELCEDYASGGLTPSIDFLRATRSVYLGLVFVMVRPRPGDFVYTDREFDTMLQQVEQFRSDGVDGFVAGMLDDHSAIDRRRLAEFMKACGPAPVTFHRAFDKIQDWRDGLDILIYNGCSRVLTSGGAPSAMEGLERLSEMIEYASGRIIVLPGGGVRSTNAWSLIDSLECAELHSAAIPTDTGNPIADEAEVNELMSICSVA
jgi:copper homeostasis protein